MEVDLVEVVEEGGLCARRRFLCNNSSSCSASRSALTCTTHCASGEDITFLGWREDKATLHRTSR